MIDYQCPGCGKTVWLPDERAGLTAKCGCGAKGRVGQPTAEFDLPDRPFVTTCRPKPSSRNRYRPFVVVAVVISAVGMLLWCVFCSGALLRNQPTSEFEYVKQLSQFEVASIIVLSEPGKKHVRGQIDRGTFEHELHDLINYGPKCEFCETEIKITLGHLANPFIDSRKVADQMLTRLAKQLEYWVNRAEKAKANDAASKAAKAQSSSKSSTRRALSGA